MSRNGKIYCNHFEIDFKLVGKWGENRCTNGLPFFHSPNPTIIRGENVSGIFIAYTNRSA